MDQFLPWRKAMDHALYGAGGFYRAAVSSYGPAAHFRTSPHASPRFGAALWRLISGVDAALGHPDRLDVVDMAAGGGELLAVLHQIATGRADAKRLGRRVRLTGVELAPRPANLATGIEWQCELGELTGVLVANEWLDNVPLDIAELDEGGTVRTVTVNPATGAERLGEPVDGEEAAWLRRWWPLHHEGDRAEIGQPREAAWAAAVGRVRAGLALAIDYGHLRADRPPLGSLTGYRAGGQVVPVPDGSCDITADVAVDAVAAAGRTTQRNGDSPSTLIRQRTALNTLGVTGTRPPRELATEDPAAYLAALGRAGQAAELTDPAGLGGFWWLAQPIGLSVEHQRTLTQCLGARL